MDVSKGFHHILLGVDAAARITRAATPAPIIIRRIRNDLPSFHKDSSVETRIVLHAHIHCARVIYEFLEDPGLTEMEVRAAIGKGQGTRVRVMAYGSHLWGDLVIPSPRAFNF
jgi:hypothetical protein